MLAPFQNSSDLTDNNPTFVGELAQFRRPKQALDQVGHGGASWEATGTILMEPPVWGSDEAGQEGPLPPLPAENAAAGILLPHQTRQVLGTT